MSKPWYHHDQIQSFVAEMNEWRNLMSSTTVKSTGNCPIHSSDRFPGAHLPKNIETLGSKEQQDRLYITSIH